MNASPTATKTTPLQDRSKAREHYSALAAEAEARAQERAALTAALAEVRGFLDDSRLHTHETTDPDARQALEALTHALRYLIVAVDNLSDRLRAIEDGGVK